MSLNDISSGERVHIGFFGKRNVGKSSVVNAVTGQQLSVVSDIGGTTTDPVKKAMELLPIGPVVITDTAGLDDDGELGKKRVEKTREVLAKTDIAILVTDCVSKKSDTDNELIKEFEKRNLPYITVYNKSDLLKSIPQCGENEIYVSAKNNYNISELKEMIGKLAEKKGEEKHIIYDLLDSGDTVVMVTPIDESAPKGRLILPQQLTLREILDAHCTAVVCRETELQNTLDSLGKKPKVVITDSQVFGYVDKIVPKDVLLTSFSVLFARYKGELNSLLSGAKNLKSLKDGDTVLISEGCTHHRQCNDIGTVKMPAWIRQYAECKPDFLFTSGGEFPKNLNGISLVVHCGGCMLNEKEMKNRIRLCEDAGVPIVNYGAAIAAVNGILNRSCEIFSEKQNT